MPKVQQDNAASGKSNDWGPGREPFRDGTTDPKWTQK